MGATAKANGYDYFLNINGISKHLGSNVERNEKNYGLGIKAQKGGRFLTLGQYMNSEGNNSYYAGGGIKKTWGKNYQLSIGALAGAVSGYEKKIQPVAMPLVTFAKKDVGEINMMYAPKVGNDPAVLMFNLGIPIK